MSTELRTRLLDATFAEVEANGLRGLTVEGVAARASSSRATIYRHFPGGRDELVRATIEHQVGEFFARVTADAPGPHDVVGHVAALVSGAHRLLGEHEVLQQLLREEAEAFLPSLAVVNPMVHSGLARHLASVFAAAALRDGLSVAEAADHAARMVLSYIGTQGSWDLADPGGVMEMVRTMILPGVIEPLATEVPHPPRL